MYTAELFFGKQAHVRWEQAESAIYHVVAALHRNGQIIDRDLAFIATRGGYKSIVGLPEQDSFRPSLFSADVRTAIRQLKKHNLQPPLCRVLGVDLDSRPVCTCRKPPSFVLTTGFPSTEVPLRCGGCRGVVPLYRVPHTTKDGTYEDVRFWAWRYFALDEIWIQSGVGERFAYRELSRHDSDLSKLGRDICQRIEKRTRVPAYYYLYRWYARSVSTDRKRRCPSCHGQWLLDSPWHNLYDFRCDHCRLVSQIGGDVW